MFLMSLVSSLNLRKYLLVLRSYFLMPHKHSHANTHRHTPSAQTHKTHQAHKILMTMQMQLRFIRLIRLIRFIIRYALLGGPSFAYEHLKRSPKTLTARMFACLCVCVLLSHPPCSLDSFRRHLTSKGLIYSWPVRTYHPNYCVCMSMSVCLYVCISMCVCMFAGVCTSTPQENSSAH
jgi:hypothetical protein